MARFRKKPIEIEAFQVGQACRAARYAWDALPSWLREAYERGEVVFLPESVEIVTLEGRMTGVFGDWIIRGVKGELYPCKGDIFAATYDAVEPLASAGSDGRPDAGAVPGDLR